MIFTSIQSKLICQLGQAAAEQWESCPSASSERGLLYDFKPQSQVGGVEGGGRERAHRGETVERSRGLKEKGAIWLDRLDQRDKVVE